MSKVNKVVRIALSGGLIGWLTTNPRKAIDDTIDKQNQDDWNAIYFAEHKTSNLIVTVFQIIILMTFLCGSHCALFFLPVIVCEHFEFIHFSFFPCQTPLSLST